ncbi:MAG: beta-glucanase (GH16 family) [Flavobacteriales bacterium]|jgi:beta-glucanase (GH16 family)
MIIKSKHFKSLLTLGILIGSQQSLAQTKLIQAEDYTLAFDTSTGNTGGAYRQGNVDIESTSDEGAGFNVGWIDQGEWLAYQHINFPKAGKYSISARVASPIGGELSFDLNGGTIPLTTMTVPNTNSWTNWTTVSNEINIAEAGIYDLGVFANTGNWNFNWIEITAITEPNDGAVVWAVNAGGPAHHSSDDVQYLADEGFAGGNTASTTQGIDATPDPTIYQTERWGSNFTYANAVDNGTYTINLKLAEIYWQSGGQRKFSVNAEGQTRLPSVDIAGDKGNRSHAGYDLTIPNIVVTDGELNIDFNGILDAAKVSAFVVRREYTPTSEWVMVWSDEFDTDGAIDANKWTHEEWAPGRVNNEWQRYTNRTENVRNEGGKLIIEARKDNYMGDEYSSGRIHSSGKADLLYGRIEVKAKLPNGVGTWPAIWMMPSDVYTYATTCDATTGWDDDCDAWPNSGEIDIMEHVGYDTGKVHATVHNIAGYWVNGQQRQASIWEPTVDDGFHTYAIEWSPDRIDMFLDGSLYYTYINQRTGWQQWPYDHEFHVILNLVVGGDWGGVAGVDPNIWPQRLEVDYVRMYKK